MDNFESTFFITTFLSREEAEILSQSEVELLAHLDQFLIAITNENRHEFLQEIVVGVSHLKELFDDLDVYFSDRSDIIKGFSIRHNEITQRLKSLDKHLAGKNESKPISEFTRKLEDRYSGVAIIHIKLLEVFHNHLDSYMQFADSSGGSNQSVVDYFKEYLKIIDNAKFIQETAPDEDSLNLKDMLELSGHVEEYAAKTIQGEAPQTETGKKGGSPLIAIAAVVALVIIAAIIYFYIL